MKGATCGKESPIGRRRRPTYSPEFKAEAIRLLRSSSDPVKKDRPRPAAQRLLAHHPDDAMAADPRLAAPQLALQSWTAAVVEKLFPHATSITADDSIPPSATAAPCNLSANAESRHDLSTVSTKTDQEGKDSPIHRFRESRIHRFGDSKIHRFSDE